MSKHTHTEWLREENTVYALNVEGSNRFVAQVQGGWATEGRLRTDESELEANARLIAAAPEMLEALIRARRALAWASEQRPEFESEYEFADHAIAKATGK